MIGIISKRPGASQRVPKPNQRCPDVVRADGAAFVGLREVLQVHDEIEPGGEEPEQAIEGDATVDSLVSRESQRQIVQTRVDAGARRLK